MSSTIPIRKVRARRLDRSGPPNQVDVDAGFSHWMQDLSNVAHHAFSIGAMLLFVIPLIWMVSMSMRQVGLPPPSQMEWIPTNITLTNYVTVQADLLPFNRYLANSLKVVAVAVPATIITASWAGLAVTQIAPRPRRWLMVISVATLMVPVTALWITRFMIYKWIGVLDSLWVLILPAFVATSPFYVLLFYWSFSRIPRELFEAARLEGASALRVWWSVAMPLSRPAITAVGVLTFVLYWSNFLDPLLYLNNQEFYTLPIGLRALHQMRAVDFPLLMAGAVMITLPVIAMFMLAQRYFLQDARGASWLGR